MVGELGLRDQLKLLEGVSAPDQTVEIAEAAAVTLDTSTNLGSEEGTTDVFEESGTSEEGTNVTEGELLTESTGEGEETADTTTGTENSEEGEEESTITPEQIDESFTPATEDEIETTNDRIQKEGLNSILPQGTDQATNQAVNAVLDSDVENKDELIGQLLEGDIDREELLQALEEDGIDRLQQLLSANLEKALKNAQVNFNSTDSSSNNNSSTDNGSSDTSVAGQPRGNPIGLEPPPSGGRVFHPSIPNTTFQGDIPDLSADDQPGAERFIEYFLNSIISVNLSTQEQNLIKACVISASSIFDIPITLILAVMFQESGGDPNAGSHAGAQGLMQLMPATYSEQQNIARRDINSNSNLALLEADLQFKQRITTGSITDIVANIHLGTMYLRRMIDHFNGDVLTGIAAYNSGPGGVGQSDENRLYQEAVPNHWKRFDAKAREFAGQNNNQPPVGLDLVA